MNRTIQKLPPRCWEVGGNFNSREFSTSTSTCNSSHKCHTVFLVVRVNMMFSKLRCKQHANLLDRLGNSRPCLHGFNVCLCVYYVLYLSIAIYYRNVPTASFLLGKTRPTSEDNYTNEKACKADSDFLAPPAVICPPVFSTSVPMRLCATFEVFYAIWSFFPRCSIVDMIIFMGRKKNTDTSFASAS
jgi:hypothetical protein